MTLTEAQKTILIIDDEKEIRELLQGFFEEIGYKILTAEDLSETVFVLNREEPDIVFLDIVLPGVSGLEILKLLKKLKKDIIVVMMSGYATEAKAKHSLQLGAFDYLRKPFDLSHVKNMLNMMNSSIL